LPSKTVLNLQKKNLPKLRIKNSFIPWSFPEIVALDQGLFEKGGLDVELYTLKTADVEPGDKIIGTSHLSRTVRSTPILAARGLP